MAPRQLFPHRNQHGQATSQIRNPGIPVKNRPRKVSVGKARVGTGAIARPVKRSETRSSSDPESRAFFLALTRTKLINIAPRKIPSCTPARSSAISNSPRAEVWLAGRIVCISRACPASNFKESVVRQFSIVPATGLHSEKQHGFRRVPSKQGPPKGSFLNFLSSDRHAPKVAFVRPEGHTVARIRAPTNQPCHSESG